MRHGGVMKKKKFHVYADSITIYKATVWAKDEDEANAIAHEMDGGDFKVDSDGDWNDRTDLTEEVTK